MAAAASTTIFDFAYSIRIAPRSDDSRNVPCSADIAEPAHAASLNSTNASGTLPWCVPFVCIRRRLKPGKLCLCFLFVCLCLVCVGGGPIHCDRICFFEFLLDADGQAGCCCVECLMFVFCLFWECKCVRECLIADGAIISSSRSNILSIYNAGSKSIGKCMMKMNN